MRTTLNGLCGSLRIVTLQRFSRRDELLDGGFVYSGSVRALDATNLGSSFLDCFLIEFDIPEELGILNITSSSALM